MGSSTSDAVVDRARRPLSVAFVLALIGAGALTTASSAAAQGGAGAPGVPGASVLPGQRAPAAAPDDDGDAEPVPTLPDGTRRVRGRVVTPRDSATVGVAAVWVTLHRVGPDAAGPLDSVRTDARGTFAFRFRPTGDARAVYFVAASRGGVAYFAPPVRAAVTEGDAAEITVFDTTSRPVRLTVRGRHLIISRPGPQGLRDVLEVYELSNDSTVTAVPSTDASRGVWSVPIPRGATSFAVRESGDVPADGLAAIAGRATLLAPVAPGLKQVAFTYQLPDRAFPLTVPLGEGTGLVEVLLEDSGATAVAAGLAQVAPVTLEGKTFRRFLARDAHEGPTLTVNVTAATLPDAPRRVVPILLGVLGGGMTVALLLSARRRTVGPVEPRQTARRGGAGTAGTEAPVLAATDRPRPDAAARPADDRDRASAGEVETPSADHLLAELAALEDAYGAHQGHTDAERVVYASRRAALHDRLAGVLARAGGAA